MRGSNLADKFGLDNGDYGSGSYVRNMPKVVTVKYNGFSTGFNVSDSAEDVSETSSPDMMDMEVSRRDRIVKAPGTTVLENLLGHVPKQIAVHASLDFRTEIILFDPPYLGVKSDSDTNWIATTMDPALTAPPYFWASFAETFIFANGVGPIRARAFGDTTVTDYPDVPNGATFAVFAGRFVIGGVVIDGVKQPLAYAYSGVDGFDKFNYDTDLGSGFEYLINDQSIGDRIVALRPMGLDILAYLCRKSVWIGRRTGDLDRPIDVAPRVTGKGCVSEACAKTVYGGVMYLSDEGVEMFDGNDSVHLSAAIDADFLPLDVDNIKLYSTSYDPTTQYFYLYTPTRTYVYDLIRQRWYRRSLKVFGGVPFATQISGTTWGEIIGTWDDVVGKTWGSYAGGEAAAPKMVFLGIDDVFRYTLHEESYISYENLGHSFLPYWTSISYEQTNNVDLVSTKRMRIKYANGGDVNLWLPDNNGSFEQVNPAAIALPFSSDPYLIQRQSMYTGLGAGMRIEFVDGTPEIIEMQQDVLPRGPRITADAPFTPREYQADF